MAMGQAHRGLVNILDCSAKMPVLAESATQRFVGRIWTVINKDGGKQSLM
jgi:hypothetical protein